MEKEQRNIIGAFIAYRYIYDRDVYCKIFVKKSLVFDLQLSRCISKNVVCATCKVKWKYFSFLLFSLNADSSLMLPLPCHLSIVLLLSHALLYWSQTCFFFTIFDIILPYNMLFFATHPHLCEFWWSIPFNVMVKYRGWTFNLNMACCVSVSA